jgi:CRP-like cAMP-binding protein
VSRGRKPAFVRVVAQTPGEVCRIEVDALEEAQSRSATLADAIARSSDCLLAYLLQAVACNRLHTLEQRMASLLLWVQDRQERGDPPLTQEDREPEEARLRARSAARRPTTGWSCGAVSVMVNLRADAAAM